MRPNRATGKEMEIEMEADYGYVTLRGPTDPIIKRSERSTQGETTGPQLPSPSCRPLIHHAMHCLLRDASWL